MRLSCQYSIINILLLIVILYLVVKNSSFLGYSYFCISLSADDGDNELVMVADIISCDVAISVLSKRSVYGTISHGCFLPMIVHRDAS